MESLACATPVIASTARGVAELVGGDAGIVFPTTSVIALARSMDWIVDHPVEARSMGARGRSRMQRVYDLRLLIARHERLYREVLRVGHR